MQEVLEQKGDSGIKAAGWLNQMQNFQTFFGLKLGEVSCNLFLYTDGIYRSLVYLDACLKNIV
jgi:hypothetical protein